MTRAVLLTLCLFFVAACQPGGGSYDERPDQSDGGYGY